MKNFIASVILILIPLLIFAQSGPNAGSNYPESKGLIKGKIIDESSSVAMEYTSIAVFSMKDSSLITGTVTDPSGFFQLKNIPFGKYYVEIQFVGYEKKTLNSVMVRPDSKLVDLGTVELSVNRKLIQEAEIVADQRRVEYKLDKKVVNVSEDLSAAGGTAVDVLENTPSVSVDIEGNVSLRGSSSFTVLINGKPTVLDAADALRQIPASNIQNIEIITNPSVKYDPDGNAGILNVVLKKQIERGTTGIINASLGLNHKYRFDALLNKRVGKANYFIGGGYNDNIYQGELTREKVIEPNSENPQYVDANGNFNFIRGGAQLKAGMDYDFTSKSNLAFEMSGGQYSFGMDRSNISHEYIAEGTEDLYFNNISMMNRDGLYYSGNLSFSHQFDSANHKIVAIGYFSQRTGDELEDLENAQIDEFNTPLNSETDSRKRNIEIGNGYEYRFQVDYTKPVGEKGKFEAGYQIRIDDNLDDYQYQEYDPDTREYINIAENSSEISFYRNIQSLYAQYGGQIGPIQVQAGLRGEYTLRQINYPSFNSSNEINRFDFYPTLHLARQFENDNQLMLSYSKRVNRPRSYFLDSIPSYIDNYTIRIGNPALEPEYVHSIELGYQKGWGKNFAAFEAYYRKTNNMITRYASYDSISGITYMTSINLNEDHVAGGEVMANWQFAKWLKVNASTNVYYYRLIGEVNDEVFDDSNVSWNANLNATVSLSTMSRIQTNIGYHGPSVMV